ncbi:unnamed protein product [Prorocentrum cordatum]|uniref:Uncharacterized protein n=1 Tax=Prorocentrum cordatum TaxID=2364126 RepID=A0ABN9Q5V2_9DINO|nr:unnamed protein product [Polarella glacialis]
MITWTHRRLGSRVTGHETLDLEPWSFAVSSLEAVEEEGDAEMQEAEDPGGPVDDAGEEEGARAGEVDTGTAAEPPLEVDARVRGLVQEVHVNLGHPRVPLFLRILRAAHAKKEILDYVKSEFVCPDCAAHPRPASRRQVATPHTFQFNRVVGVDTFFVSFEGRSIAFLNCIDHGTNYQVVARYEGGRPGRGLALSHVGFDTSAHPSSLSATAGPSSKGNSPWAWNNTGCTNTSRAPRRRGRTAAASGTGVG